MVSDQVCGDTWRELLVKFDQSSAWWKTAHCLWEEALPESSVTLPRWGMMRSGECWEREMPEHLTSGTESGSWPTIRASGGERGGRGDLIQAVRGNPNAHYKMWPTPSARDWKDSPGMSKEGVNPDGSVRKRDDQLARRVFAAEEKKLWPTPCAGDFRGPNRNPGRSGQKIMPASEHSLPTKVGGQLNPSWVEWLMGWPIGWTDSNVSATDKSPSVQHWPGES